MVHEGLLKSLSTCKPVSIHIQVYKLTLYIYIYIYYMYIYIYIYLNAYFYSISKKVLKKMLFLVILLF